MDKKLLANLIRKKAQSTSDGITLNLTINMPDNGESEDKKDPEYMKVSGLSPNIS